MADEQFYMQMALKAAAQGRGYTSPNPMVGAVIVRDGRIVAQGYHQGAGQAHAEVNAIKNAGQLAQGATLYVTLEPCNHFGRTPPCTHKILESGLQKVVAAMLDPNPDVAGNGLQYLQQHGVEVLHGVCEAEAQQLNEAFIKYIVTKRPFVTAKCAATLDGYIAASSGDSKWVTGPHARRQVHQLRHGVDAILVGRGTVMQDNPSLTTRLENVASLDPIRIILDTHLSIPMDARVLHLDSAVKTILVCAPQAAQGTKAAQLRKYAEIIPLELYHNQIDIDQLMKYLGTQGITSLLVEGGGQVLSSFFAADRIDKIVFFWAPKILGGNDGTPICKGKGPKLINDCIRVKDMQVKLCGEDVMITGYPVCQDRRPES